MTSETRDTGRPGATSSAVGALRGFWRDPIHRRVAVVVVLGAAMATVVLRTATSGGAVLESTLLRGPWLLLALAALTCLAELTTVRLRHGDAVEQLTVYEAALVIDVLLLPPRGALAAAALGLVLATLVQRRPFVKAVFNVGTYTAAVSALIIVLHAVGGTPGTMTAGVLVGVLLGILVFTAINLCCLAQILGVVSGTSPWRIVVSEARLSAFMAIGTGATGLKTVAIGLHAPPLLPFMASP